MNTVGYIDVVGETKLIMLELAELQKENEQLRAELSAAQWNAQRIIEWMDDPNRKPAIHAFTAGNERQIAYRYERVISDAAMSRADAIRECAKELRRRADHAQSTGNHLPGTDRARELHVEARVLARTATALLESLTKKEGDDGPTAKGGDA